MRRFEPGEAVVLRETLHGRIWTARALTVVRDSEEAWMFYIPIGTRWLGPGRDRDDRAPPKARAAGWTLEEHRWTRAHVLSFAWPGAGHAVLHYWGEDWTPQLWYVNVEAPLRRFEHGFDTLDHDLDVVIEADRSAWRWKDEDEVAEGVRLGFYAPEEAAAFRTEAERGLRRVLDREPPFDREWTDWRPDASWPVPTLPEGWDEPPTI